MTRYIFLLLTCLWSSALFGQVPNGINFQAIAWDGNGPIVTQPVDVRLTILDLPANVTVYQETHTVITNDYGLFTLVIGEGTPVTGTFASIDWGVIQANIQTELDTGGGWTVLSITPFQSVPYAFEAENVTPFPLDELSDVATPSPTNGEVLKWNGTAWAPAADNGTAYTAGTGIDLTGNTITNTGDNDPSDDITNTTAAGGDLSGTYPDPTVVGIQGFNVSPVPPTVSEVLKWNGTQWEPGADNGTAYIAGQGIQIVGNVISNTGDLDTTNDISNASSANGDVNGTFYNTKVVGLQNHPISNVVPLTNQVLKWTGTEWIPSDDLTANYTAGVGISIVGTAIHNTGDLDPTDDITVFTPAGGDLSGTYPTPTVVGLNGIPILPASPQNGQVLKYNSLLNGWVPAEDQNTDTVLVRDAAGNIRVEGGVNAGDGFVNVYDAAGALRAGLRINAGQGEVFGDIKNFRVAHPAEPEKEIWYASLEGPEAAAYLRGTATLVDGKADIPFPDHFQHIAVQAGMTVLLTPLSGESRGLAVVKKSLQGLEVVELMKGSGNYSFDWEVKCVRQGHEEFEVVRPATTSRP